MKCKPFRVQAGKTKKPKTFCSSDWLPHSNPCEEDTIVTLYAVLPLDATHKSSKNPEMANYPHACFHMTMTWKIAGSISLTFLRSAWESGTERRRLSDSPNHLPYFLALSAAVVTVQIRLGGAQLG